MLLECSCVSEPIVLNLKFIIILFFISLPWTTVLLNKLLRQQSRQNNELDISPVALIRRVFANRRPQTTY